MTEAMKVTEVISDNSLVTKIKENTLHSETNLEVVTIEVGYTEDQIITEIEVTAGNKGSEVNPDPLPEDLKLHQGRPAEIM